MTEAFYRNIPLIALTFHNPSGNEYNMTPQYLDRSVTQKDIKALYVKLPKIADANDEIECVVKLNAALFTAYYLKKPVHIDCPSTLWNFKDKLQVPLKKYGSRNIIRKILSLFLQICKTKNCNFCWFS
ncbi:MAG: hypothetical protein ACLU99_08385 [Alphaproteobacteria bacterium]